MTEHTPDTQEAPEKSRKIELIIGAGVLIVAAGLFFGIVSAFQNAQPKVVYEPAAACAIFTQEEAVELLGERASRSGGSEPELTGNFAVSRCGYSDGASEKDELKVAAISLRAAINDQGIEQNKTDFTAGQQDPGVEILTGIGDEAYFNAGSGQLNILSDKNWYILSYGVGSSPLSNTVEDAAEMAKFVVES